MTYDTRRSGTFPPEPRRTRSYRAMKTAQMETVAGVGGNSITNHAALFNLAFATAGHVDFCSLATDQTLTGAKRWETPANKTAIIIQAAAGQTASLFRIIPSP